MGRDLADEFRSELRDFYKDRLDLEKRISSLEAFMNRHDAVGHPRRSPDDSMPSTSLRVAKVTSKKDIIIAIIVAFQGIVLAYLAFKK